MKKPTPKTFTKKKSVPVFVAKPKKEKQTARPKKVEFPKIFRIIPEAIRLSRIPTLDVVFVVSFLSGMVLVGLILGVYALHRDMQTLTGVKAERIAREREVTYWTNLVEKYPDYRDGYFKLSQLYYQLGDTRRAMVTLEKVKMLDPNFAPAGILTEKLAGK